MIKWIKNLFSSEKKEEPKKTTKNNWDRIGTNTYTHSFLEVRGQKLELS